MLDNRKAGTIWADWGIALNMKKNETDQVRSPRKQSYH